MKIKLNQLVLVLILSVSLFSCKKESPLDVVGPVTFVFDGEIGNTPSKFEAGVNNYILSTNFTDAGVNDILLMSGAFVNKTSTTDDVLQFEFYGHDAQDNSNLLTNVFTPGNIFSTSTDSVTTISGDYQFRFDALNNPAMSHKWDFGDGATATGASVTHAYSPGSAVNVKLITTTSIVPTISCTDSVTNSIVLNDLNCQIQFETLLASATSYSFEATQGYNNYKWLIDSVDQMINNRTIYQNFGNPLRKVVELIATQGSCTTSWKAVIIPDSTNGCFAGYKFTVLQQPAVAVGPRSPIKTAVITYTTNGKTYKSQKSGNSNQSNEVVFGLAEASAYDNNPAGQKSIQLKGNVNTMLYNISDPNDSLSIKSTNLSIAVAHP